jgi:hypothetical protein
MDQNIFSNTDISDKFTSTNETYKFNQTVFKNMNSKQIIKKDNYVVRLMDEKISNELILKEFSFNNENLKTAKLVLLPRISDNLDIIKFADDNKLLLNNDYLMIFLNLVACFDKYIDTTIMDYIYEKNKSIIWSEHSVTAITNYIMNNINNDELILFDWYYQKNIFNFVFLMSYLLVKTKSDKIFSYIDHKPDNIYELADFQLIQSICSSCDLEKIIHCMNKVENKIKNISKLINASLANSNKEVILFMIGKDNNYKCTNFKFVLTFLEKNEYEIAKILCDKFEGTIDDFNLVNFIYTKNNIEILKFFLDNTKINIHVKNNTFFKYLLLDENYEMLKYLLDNDDKLGTFYEEKDKEYIQKIIKNILNENILELLKIKYNIYKTNII